MVAAHGTSAFYRWQVRRIHEFSARCTNPAIKLELFEIAAQFEDRAQESDRRRQVAEPA
jgi:hypothetical protein